jgi:hypothetical protein
VRRLLLLAAAIMLAVPASAAGTGALIHASRSASFVTPSGNITCRWSADPDRPSRTYLRCDGVGLNPRPKQPPTCEYDWANGISMTSSSRAAPNCVSDALGAKSPRVLPYRSLWRRRGFTCLSESVGLICVNSVGHGFFLSKERWRVF